MGKIKDVLEKADTESNNKQAQITDEQRKRLDEFSNTLEGFRESSKTAPFSSKKQKKKEHNIRRSVR